MSEPLVIVGNGMAAACLCEELAQRALGRYAVAGSCKRYNAAPSCKRWRSKTSPAGCRH
jgi:NAD(P)H-nitrite reductase large subunit